jgi:hypothetical protein
MDKEVLEVLVEEEYRALLVVLEGKDTPRPNTDPLCVNAFTLETHSKADTVKA